MSDIFQILLKKKILEKKIYTGTTLKGKVIKITNKHVLINVGLKSEAYINIEEFYDNNKNIEVKVNDEIDVMIENLESAQGTLQLSREKVKKLNAWKKLEKIHTQNLTVQGKVLNRIKGGFIVETESIKAFLPGSLVDLKPLKDYSRLEGQILDFKILKINQKTNNIVLSRKAILEETTGVDKNIVLSNLHKNQIVSGIIKNIADYGAFVDLGGIDGLLHITDISWGRIKHPSSILTIGQFINVKITKFDQQKNRVSLGLKQLDEDPWININHKYPKNTKITGIVTNILDYGCFVEIAPGIEGLVHISEMDWGEKNINPNKIVELNENVNVVVLSVDEKKKRISLGLKQCKENPWEIFIQKHKIGDNILGKIKSITDFGIFVELDKNIDGLIHTNDISWTKDSSEILKNFKKWETVNAVILSIESSKERISLGIKQLTKNPILTYLEKNKKGTVVSGIVIHTNIKNTVLKLTDDITGIICTTELKEDECLIGAQITANIGGDQELKTRYISLTKKIKQNKEPLEKQYTHIKYKNTLGEIIKDQLSLQDKNKNIPKGI